ncbi:hypothetical protein [Azospirillum tabaci]|uniref:hypothetical protein n=1 Tax=Azospirillum tabaci TaxID=2752310 RepID=UPI001660F586|nr:hypothetical protein [Azospirillum tabaci]
MGKGSGYTDQPNKQQAIETTIPVLCTVIMGFMGAIVVTAALNETTALDNWMMLMFPPFGGLTVPFQGRIWTAVTALMSGAFLLMSMTECVKSQCSNFRSSPDIDLLDKHISMYVQAWERSRLKHARNAIVYYNIGIGLMMLPLIPFMPRVFSGYATIVLLLLSIVGLCSAWSARHVLPVMTRSLSKPP